jgi:hypothetical protein
MENVEILKRFIVDNNLQFTEGRRNSDSTIISGFALHIGETEITNIEQAIEEAIVEPDEYYDELEKVFEYAKNNNYHQYWTSKDAKKQYKF